MAAEGDVSALLAAALQHKLDSHRAAEQQQVDALLASQKHLTSNVRTLLNGLDSILALAAPKHSTAQGDLVTSMASRAHTLALKLDAISDRLQRIEAHLTGKEAAAAVSSGALQGTQAAADAPREGSSIAGEEQEEGEQPNG